MKTRNLIAVSFVAAFAAHGAVWETETVHSWSGRDIGIECDIALDSSGEPHFGYIVNKLTMPFEQVLYHAWKDGASWSREQVYTNANGASTDAAIYMTGTTPTVCEIDNSIYAWRQGLRTHTKTGGVWSNTQVDQNAYGSLSAVPSGVAFASQVSSSNTTGALWFNSTLVDSGSLPGRGSGIDEHDGTIGISHHSQENGGVMKLAENSGSGWSNEIIAPMTGGGIAGSGYRSGIAYDSDGNPHVAYTDTSNPSMPMLSYAVRENAIWHTQQLARCTGGSVSVGVDSRDRPHVLFPGLSSSLMHGVGNGVGWRFMKIGTGARHSAMLVDASNSLHVAYRFPATADRLYYAVGEFVASNKLLNGQFDSDSEGWNFGDIEGDEGVIFGTIYQITDPADPSNQVCQVHAHNEWGNSECSAWLEQEIDVADRMQWLEFDYRFLDPGTHFEVKLSTPWKDSTGTLHTLTGPDVPGETFLRCGIPLPFNRQDAASATLQFLFVGGSEDDYYALVDNIVLVESGAPRLEKSTGIFSASAGAGASPPNTTFEIWNTGTNDLAYSLSPDSAWFSLPDSSGTLTGQVETVEVEFSSASLAVGSYTGELVIVASGATTPTQTVDVVLSIVPPPVSIATTALPDGEVGTAYLFQLEATNGIPPFTWTPGIAGYAEASAANSYSYDWSGQYWREDDGTWELALPFAFPFFGTNYSTCWVDSNGRITFDNSGSAPTASMNTFTNTPMIAVLWDDLTTWNGNIYVDEVAGDLVIRWDADYVGGGGVGVSLTLAEDGTITSRYISYSSWNTNGGFIGISAGNGEDYLVSAMSESGGMGGAADILFNPQSGFPDGLSLSTNGVLSGTPTTAFSNSIPVVVTESRGYFDLKRLGLLIAAGSSGDTDGDGIPDWWETLYFGGPTSCIATNHNDGDTFNNLAEYIAGTDPTNSGSFFHVANTWQDVAGFVVEWEPTSSNREYSILWTNDLSTSFQILEAGIEFPQSSYTDTVNSAQSEGFYQIEVQLKP